MPVAFDSFCLIVLFAKPTVVVLYACMGVGVWGCTSSSSVVHIGKASLSFIKVAPISASTNEDTTFWIIWHRVWMASLLVGRVGGLSPLLTSWLASKKKPPYQLHVHSLQR